MSLLKQVRREMDRAIARVAGIVRRGIVKSVTAKHMVQLTGYVKEVFDDVELWQQEGFASRPQAGAEVVVLKPQADGEAAIAVATADRTFRPTDLGAKEVRVYELSATDQAYISFVGDGTIKLITPNGVQTLTSTLEDISLEVPASGKVVKVGGSTDFLLKGTTYNSQVLTMLSAIATYLALIGTAMTSLGGEAQIPGSSAVCIAAGSPAATTANNAISNFHTTQAAARLATKGKTT